MCPFSGQLKQQVEKIVQAKGKAKAQAKKEKAEAVVEKEKVESSKKKEKVEEGSLEAVADHSIAVRICAVEAGSLRYGKEGSVSSDWLSMASDAKVQVFSVSGSFEVQAGWLRKIVPEWQKPLKWKGFNALSRFQKQQLLNASGLQPVPFFDNSDCLLSFPDSDGDFSDQHLALSVSFLLQQFSQYVEDVVVIGPLLQKCALEQTDLEAKSRFIQELREGTIEKKLILFPINAEVQKHWTLLTGVRDASGELSWSYQDSLKVQSVEARERANQLVELLCESGSEIKNEIKTRKTGIQTGSTCGYWTLVHIEAAVCERFEGPASRGWLEVQVKEAKARLKSLWGQLKKEEAQLVQAKVEAESKEKNLAHKWAEARNKAQKTLALIEDFNSVQAKKAQDALNANSMFFKAENLSMDSQVRVLRASAKFGTCSKCRYSSGCLECDAEKAFRYWLRREASEASKVPKWEGPDGWVEKNCCRLSVVWL